MNFYWGDTPMSWLRYMTLHSFRFHNPDAPITLHTSGVERVQPWESCERQDFMAYDGPDWREHLPALGVRVVQTESYGAANISGDMCRWSVLASGGLFADMDIIFTAPMPDIECDRLSCVKGVLYLGLASGRKGGAFVRVFEHALTRPIDGYQSRGSYALYHLAYGDEAFTADDVRWRYVAEHDPLPALGCANLPLSLVHPLSVERAFSDDPLPEGCCGIHWFAGSPQGQTATNTWTPENIGKGTLGEAARAAWCSP